MRISDWSSDVCSSDRRRVYGAGHVRVLGFIRRVRELGFTPAEVRVILSLGGPAQASCSEVREIAAHHLERVRAKMSDLAQLESLLATTIDRCEGDGAASCAVIELRSEEHTSELQSLMRISYAVFCLQKKQHQS